MLLEVKDVDLAANFMISKKLIPTSEMSDKDGSEEEDGDTRQCHSLLRFNTFNPHNN